MPNRPLGDGPKSGETPEPLSSASISDQRQKITIYSAEARAALTSRGLELFDTEELARIVSTAKDVLRETQDGRRVYECAIPYLPDCGAELAPPVDLVAMDFKAERLDGDNANLRYVRVTLSYASDLESTDKRKSESIGVLTAVPDGISAIDSAVYGIVQRDLVNRILAKDRIKEILPEEGFQKAVEESDLEGGTQDCGIGSYEFWGAKGVHKDIQYEISDGRGLIEASFALSEPAIPETACSASHTYFEVTSRQWTDDEVYEDGNEYEVDFKGELEEISFSRKTVEHDGHTFAYWRVDARYSWEQD